MIYRTILAALLGCPLAALADDAPIPWRDAQKAPLPELVLRSFAQVAPGFTAKDTLIVGIDNGFALFEASFGKPMEEYSPFLCKGKRLRFEYDWDKNGAAHAKRIDTEDVYAALDPTPKDDKEGKARCAQLTRLEHGTFIADSEFSALNAVYFLAQARGRAAADKSDSFTLSCLGGTDECLIAKRVFAGLDLKMIQQARHCGDDWFESEGAIHCAEVQISSNVPGPDFWYVKVDIGSDRASKIVVTMRPRYTAKPL